MNPQPLDPASPPRLATWLLSLALDDAAREAVVGDLHEEYEHLRARRGAAAAWWWFHAQAMRSIVSCRVTGRRRRDERRFDFDEGARASLRDLVRPAMRQFRDHPLYSLACVGTLALAVGAACASFAVVKHALLDPLPYRDDHELVSLLTSTGGAVSAVSPHVLEDLRASNPPLVEFAPILPTGVAYTTDVATETIGVNFVSSDYFGLLGVWPSMGRLWTPQETDAVVISADFWNERLGRTSDVIGSSITVGGRPRTIVGVMPPDYTPPYFMTTDAWAPIEMAALLSDLRGRRTLSVLARRAPNATARDLDAFMALFSAQMQERFPQVHGGQVWVARSLREELVGTARPALLGTAGAAALLLLIVGANIAGLSTAHAVALRHQLAVRAALGATRWRLFVEQLVDSTVLATVGSLAGVWVAYGLVTIVARYQEYFLGRLAPFALDGTTAAIGLAVGMTIGLAAALLPRAVVNAAPNDALKAARGSSADVKLTATRGGLVVAQVAIALVLLVGAGLLVRTVQHLSDRDLGFDSEGLMWLQVTLPGRKYQSPAAQMQFEHDVLERFRQVPAVTSAIASVGFPLWGGMMAGLGLKADAPGTPRREVAYLSVAPNFVKDVGARLIAGRDLLPTDDVNAPRVVVINETLARMLWPEGNAIGAEVQIGPGSPQEQWITVVGIMADMRAHGLTSAIRPTAFGSTRQYSWPRRHLAVRTDGPAPPTLTADLKAAIHGLDPTVAIGATTSAEQHLTRDMARHRLVMLALTLFGGVAVVLCISGVYAVIMLNSQQRRREYAIRVALGAQRGGVRWLVVRQALVLAGLGAMAGLAIAAAGTSTLQGLLHGVQPVDASTFALSGCALLLLATLAAWHPARQAERVDPVETLRAE